MPAANSNIIYIYVLLHLYVCMILFCSHSVYLYEYKQFALQGRSAGWRCRTDRLMELARFCSFIIDSLYL